MIKKLLSLLKIGSPKVDLVLHANEVMPGEKISGAFHVKGGWLQQKITRLECDLVKELPSKKVEFVEPVTTILMTRTIDANAKKEIPFQYRLTKALPPTSADVSYRFRTKLVFTDDTKSTDHDEIVVYN